MYDNYDFIIFSFMFVILAVLLIVAELFFHINEWIVNSSLVSIYVYYDNYCKILRR